MGQDVSFVGRLTSRKCLVYIFLVLLGILAVTLIMVLCFRTRKGNGDTPRPASSVSPAEPRISGESDAPKGRFPYVCSIRKRGSGRHICGGALVNDQWVMTAAHCLDPQYTHSAEMSPFLYCGIYEREAEDMSKRFISSRCFMHHLWDGNVRNGNDIALCQLKTSASVAFPDLSNIGDNFTRSDVFSVLGWGSTNSRGSLADVLQIGKGLKYVLPSRCNNVAAWAGSIKTSMMCAGFGSPETCRGDSGGPLLIRYDPDSATKSEDPLLDLIIGITSFGLPDCEADAPAVYTREQDCNDHDPCGSDSSFSSSVEAPPSPSVKTSPLPTAEASSLCLGVDKPLKYDESDALKSITTAISSDDSEIVKKILCDGLTPDAITDDFENSLLIRAAQYDAVESAKVLLKHGAEREIKNIYGQSPLSRAAEYGSSCVAQLLIDDRANIETRDKHERTPLILASRHKHAKVAQLLLQNGADTESKGEEGIASLHYGVLYNSSNIVKILIQNGADIEMKTKNGSSVLLLSTQQSSATFFPFYYKSRRFLEVKRHGGLTSLHIAAYFNYVEIATLLLENAANVDSKAYSEATPLYLASQQNSLEVAKLLILNRANIESREQDGFTPLHTAAEYNSLGVAKLLIRNGANIESQEQFEDTPLHIAARKSSLEVVKLLLQKGANIESKNKNPVL